MKASAYRVFMSVFIIGYLLTGFGSHNRKDDTWGPVYRKLRWMHTTLCLWQNWGMFAPPPGSTSWLLLEGKDKDGETVAIEPLMDPVDSGYFRWRYDRLQKVALSSYQDSRKSLRRAIAKNACHRAKEAGTPVVEVSLIRDRTWAVKPKRRWEDPDATGRKKTIELGTYKCR
jgi:hypothetical protein